MSLLRRAAKRDQAEPDIVQALEKAGARVERLSAEGLPDLLVFYAQRMYLIEAKTGTRKVRKSQVKQAEFLAWAHRNGYRVGVCRTPEDALEFVGAIH